MKRLFCTILWLLLLPSSEEMSLNKLANDEIEHSHEVYIEVDGKRLNSTLVDGKHAPRITVHVTFKNQVYLVDLTLNAYLLSSSYVEKIVSDDNVLIRHSNIFEDMCYYKGHVRDVEHSNAAFSTCQGIKGFFVINNTTYHVNPTNLNQGSYEIRKAVNDNLSRWICGTDDLKNQVNGNITHRIKRQIIEDSLAERYVVELYVAADSLVMNFYNGDVNRVTRSIKEIVNTANLLYQPLGFAVVLVGLEVWNNDPFQITSVASSTLVDWQKYRTSKVMPLHYNDVGFLISKMSFAESVLGLATMNTMCASQRSGGLVTAIDDNSAVSGAILAHEIGHTLGLTHDAQDCQCEGHGVSCIMSSMASIYRPSTYFSSCSKNQLKTSIDQGVDICLKDSPIDQSKHASICGNGILEDGEECDCGRRPIEECNPKCCNANTCKLTSSAKCASGKCCDVNSCQVKQAGVQCRSAIGTCDLPETCDGRSAYCPKNIYLHDGTSCSVGGVSAYCWSGMCRTSRSQCQLLFGPAASEGDSNCYTIYNTLGTWNGYCSVKFGDQVQYTRCQQEDAFCGSLQCNTNSAVLIKYKNYMFVTSKSVGSSQCKGVVLDYGARVENPGIVPNGASCGNGKMCVSQKCVPVASILNKNECPQCRNGVCNSEGNCQCNSGFKGPNCDQSMYVAVEDAVKSSTTTTTTTSTTTQPSTTTTTTQPTTTTTTTTPITSSTATKFFNVPTYKTSAAPQWLPPTPEVTKPNGITYPDTPIPQTPTPSRNLPDTPSNGNNMLTAPPPLYPTANIFGRVTPTRFNRIPNIYSPTP